MSKPLSSKSNLVTVNLEKHHILTVSEVMRNFSVKSPRHQTFNSDFRGNSTKKISNIKNENLKNQTKNEKSLESQSKNSELTVSKISTNSSVKNQQEENSQNHLKNLIFRKITQKGHTFFKSSPLKDKNTHQKEIKISKQLIKQKTVSKIIKEINKIGASSSSKLFHKVPSLNLSQKQKNNKSPPLSDRLPKSTKAQYYPVSVKGSKSIKLSTKNDDEIISIKSCKNSESCQFFRKASNAQTIPSKHTISMQHFEDYEQLFPKNEQPSRKNSKKNQKSNPLSTLLQVKNKILQQINSLDQKLLTTEDKRQCSVKKEDEVIHKVICLKRKKQKCLGQGVQQKN